MAFTFFFRDFHTIEKAIDLFIPQISGFSKIKIWDAGCAHGPEPYTIMITLAEKMSEYSYRNLWMYATDIDENNSFGKTIQKGIYPEAELKRIPKDIFKKYFRPADENGNYLISEKVRSKVHFTKHDLLKLSPIGTNIHLIICKNVLLHFSLEQRINVIKMYHDVLAPNGILMMEQTQPMPDVLSDKFEKMVSNANIFRKL